MVFFSLFVISAVIIGAGAMLSPAWPGAEPRIGLSSTFLLGLIAGGAVWWSELFGWDTLIIDYLLFGIVSLVILSGTMSQGRGDAAWISRADLVFLGLAALICMMPLFVLHLPLGEEAASEALISLAVRESGSFNSLVPFYPEVTGFAPPAFHALAAYLSQQLRQPIPTIHVALGSFIAFLCVWTVYDLGAEIQDKRLGRGMAIALLGSLGMLALLWQSYYSQLMGVLFAFAFITYALRYYHQHKIVDMVAAGLMLGMVIYSSLTLFTICLIAYYVTIILLSLPIRQPSKHITQWTKGHRLGLWFGILAIWLFSGGIWFLRHFGWHIELYLGMNTVGTQTNLIERLIYHLSQPLAILQLYILMASILIGIFFSRVYQLFSRDFAQKLVPHHYIIIILAFFLEIVAILICAAFASQDLASLNSPYAQGDLAAIEWIRENTPEDARILGGYFSMPAILLANRVPVEEVVQPATIASPSAIGYFWRDAQANQDVLRDYNVDYIFVTWWLSPEENLWLEEDRFEHLTYFEYGFPLGSDNFNQLSFLRLVFEQGGARVYEVIAED